MKPRHIKLAALLSGTGALMFELVWVRYLSILLGGTAYAIGVVTACYMVGLAAGSFLLGRLADRAPRAAAALVFGGFGAVCLLSPLLYRAVRALALLLGGGGLGARMAVSLAALLLPTFLAGGMVPALSVLRPGAVRGGQVYAFHTLGSMLGAGLAGFWLMGSLGLRITLGLGGLLSLCAGAMALRAVRAAGAPASQPQHPKLRDGRVYGRALQYASVAIYALSGFTAMAFQMYQTKLLTWFFMDSVYDFAVILIVFLAGSALGNFVFSALARRETDHVACLMGSQLLLGALTLCTLFLAGRLPYWTEHIQRASQLYGQFGPGAWPMGVLFKLMVTALFLLPVTFLWGGAFPLVSRICAQPEGQGRLLGKLLGWNTVGSALGSLLGSFVLVTLVGWYGAILLNGALNLLGAVALLVLRRPDRVRRWGAAFTATVVLLGGVILFPVWDRFEMSTSFLAPGQDVSGQVDFPYYREDMGGTTAVVDFLPYQQKYLITNRLYCQNTSDSGGSQDHRRLGHIPMLIRPGAQTVLVTGLGAGITLRGAAEYSGVAVDCVEISPSVIEAARCFSAENGGVLDWDNVTVISEDARSYVAATRKTYDVILADIFFPMSSGGGNLFSLEYYQDCLAALNPDGIMVQWLPLHQFSQETLEITVNTFAKVFEHTSLWFGLIGESTPVVGLVGGRQPLSLSSERLAALYAGQGRTFVNGLEDVALDDPYMFLSHFITEAAYRAESPVNTEDLAIVEYLTPRITQSYQEMGKNNLRFLLEQKSSAAPYLTGAGLNPDILEQYDQEIRGFIALFQ
jgi:spermidine synthase